MLGRFAEQGEYREVLSPFKVGSAIVFEFQNGTGVSPSSTLIHFSSVNSSMLYLPPLRPIPELP